MMWLWQKEVMYNSLVPRIHAEIKSTHNFTGLGLQQKLRIGVRWLFEVNKYTTNILHTRGKLVPHVWVLDRIHTAAQTTNHSLGHVGSRFF